MKRFVFLIVAIVILGSCEKNSPPTIKSISISPVDRNAGLVFTLKGSAYDGDYDPITYAWSADAGEFPEGNTGNPVQWKSPVEGEGTTVTLTMSVSDKHHTSEKDTTLLLTNPLYGFITGNVVFEKCQVEIPGVTVALGDTLIVSDELGRFDFLMVPIGDYTLTATKEGFNTAHIKVNVEKDKVTMAELPMTSSQYTTLIKGYVKDQDSLPLNWVSITMVNPDGSMSGLKGVTDDAGYYQIESIPMGNRSFSVVKESSFEYSYYPYNRTQTIANQQQTINFSLYKKTLNGTFTDPRDNRTYYTRYFGETIWMVENLAWLPGVNPISNASVDYPRYYVYDYDGSDTTEAKASSNYREYGVLYNHVAAETACPPGWRLPSSNQWNHFYSYRPDEGYKMKSVSGWMNQGNGTNYTGFSGIPGGMYVPDNGFTGRGEYAGFWSSQKEVDRFYGYVLQSAARSLSSVKYQTSTGLSVRCMRDY